MRAMTISLTDIARYKNPDHPDDVVRNWLRNRSTVEFLGIWERLNNPAFNPVEFDGVGMQRGNNRSRPRRAMAAAVVPDRMDLAQPMTRRGTNVKR